MKWGEIVLDVFPQQWTYDDVVQRYGDGASFAFLDVREQHEWDTGHIEGAVHIPLGQLTDLHSALDRTKHYVVVCQGGVRSNKACWLLSEYGYTVSNFVGGMLRWEGLVE